MDAVRRLASICAEAAGQDLKLTLRGHDEQSVPGQFLAVAGGAVVGYVGVDQGRDAEICGMVHPARRGRGTGTLLLDAALTAAAALGRESALVICEEAAPWAMEWMRRRGGVLDSSELRMVLRLEPGGTEGGTPGGRFQLRPSTAPDRPVLRHLLREGFPDIDEASVAMMVGRHDTVEEESLIAWDGDRPVGTLRVIDTPGRSMIYGLVIDRALRGRGYGGAAMRVALDQLRARGVRQVSLEVLPDNQPAVRLYTGLGFSTVTTYRYLRVPTGRGARLS